MTRYRHFNAFLSSIQLRRGELLALALSLLPVYLVLSLIHRYGVNAPYEDIWDWSVTNFAQRRGFNLADFWMISNEHRVIFPRILDFLIEKYTSLNMLARTYAKVPVAILGFLACMGSTEAEVSLPSR